jgi:hypothetical protein
MDNNRTQGPMNLSRTIAAAALAACCAWAPPAAALDRVRAIEVAKKEVGDKCKAEAACTFTAKAEGNKWHVRVDFPRKAGTKATHRDHSIFILGPTGRIVGRIEGKK